MGHCAPVEPGSFGCIAVARYLPEPPVPLHVSRGRPGLFLHLGWLGGTRTSAVPLILVIPCL